MLATDVASRGLGMYFFFSLLPLSNKPLASRLLVLRSDKVKAKLALSTFRVPLSQRLYTRRGAAHDRNEDTLMALPP